MNTPANIAQSQAYSDELTLFLLLSMKIDK